MSKLKFFCEGGVTQTRIVHVTLLRQLNCPITLTQRQCPHYLNSDNVHIALTQTMSEFKIVCITLTRTMSKLHNVQNFCEQGGGLTQTIELSALPKLRQSNCLHYPNSDNVHITLKYSDNVCVRQCPS